MAAHVFSLSRFDKTLVKMPFHVVLAFLMIVSSCTGRECTQKNISCSDINTTSGFNFSHEAPEGSKIYVYANKTVIAHGPLKNQSSNYSVDESQVKSMDNTSIVTKHCQDLQIEFTVPDGNDHIKDRCIYYNVTDNQQRKPPREPEEKNLVGIIIGVCLFATGLAIIGLYCCYCSDKKELSFFRYLRNLTCLRKIVRKICDEELGMEGIGLSDMVSAPGPRGRDEDDAEQDNTPGSGHTQSIDPTDDGETPQSLSNLCNEEIPPSQSGETRDYGLNRASNDRDMYRNLGDDPGGVNDQKGKDIVRDNGWTPGDCGPEDLETVGQPLLRNHRADIPGFDMTDKAAVLVNKLSFDPDQVSRCPPAPESDVESTI